MTPGSEPSGSNKDLRTRLAAVVGRSQPASHVARDAITPEPPGSRSPIAVSIPAPRSARSAPPFETSEERIAVADLDLEIVGHQLPDPLLAIHLGLRGEAPRRWEDVLFLDTETTGLSSGTGTYVFLLGTAAFCEGELILRQYLLRDLAAEREFIAMLRAELDRFRACATYNGKCFDLPLLRTRVVLALRADLKSSGSNKDLSVDDAHLDLLHPARRLWRGRYGSTSLRQLEESVLDEGRSDGDDITGALIPERYFRYLRERDPRLLAPILRHNARDVLSLVRIADRVARAVLAARTGRAPDHAPAALALARVFERTGEDEPAFCCYESAYVDGDAEVRVRAALPFARALERRGEGERALRMLETLLDLGLGTPSWRGQAEARVRRLSRVTRGRPRLRSMTSGCG